MLDYLERLRNKPGHVRERIAALSAAGVTAVVALGWIAVTATNGTFLIAPPSFAAASDPNLNSAVAQTKSGFSNLLGAAAAYQTGGGAASGQPGSQAGIVIETSASTSVDTPAPTALSF